MIPGLPSVTYPGGKTMTPCKDELWAFWKYDQFPYFLGGRVIYFLDDGQVKTREYSGRTFTPVTLIHGPRGGELLAWLRAARTAYRNRQEVVKNSARKATRAHLKDYGLSLQGYVGLSSEVAEQEFLAETDLGVQGFSPVTGIGPHGGEKE